MAVQLETYQTDYLEPAELDMLHWAEANDTRQGHWILSLLVEIANLRRENEGLHHDLKYPGDSS